MKSFLSWKKKNFLWKVCWIFWSLLMQTDEKDNSFWHKKIQVFIFNLHFISSVNEVIFSKWSKEICSLQVNDVSPWEHPFYTCNTPLFYKKSVALFSASEKYAALTSTAFSLRWACAELFSSVLKMCMFIIWQQLFSALFFFNYVLFISFFGVGVLWLFGEKLCAVKVADVAQSVL